MRSRIAPAALTTFTICLAACGGGGGGGGSSGSGSSGAAGPVDLALYAVHYHQDYFENPRYPAFYFSIRNDSDASARQVDWVVRRLDGASPIEKRGTVASIPAHAAVGSGHDIHVEWADPSLAPGRYTYQVTIDPDMEIASETDRSNNSYVFIVDIPATIRAAVADDIKFQSREPHFHTLLRTPDTFDFHFIADNTAATPAVGVTWRVRSSALHIDERRPLAAIPGNGSIEDSLSVVITQPGDHEIEVSLDPGRATDTDSGNNARTFIVHVAPNGGG